MAKETTRSGTLGSYLEWTVHILALIILAFTAVWIWYFREGTYLSPWSAVSANYAAAIFNVHPPLMVLAFVVLYSEAAILFRSELRTKASSKFIHMIIQGIALILAIVALIFTWRYKVIRKVPHFYSLHSWLGLSAMAAFFLQWLSGFTVFWYPGGAPSLRAKLLPLHTFTGVFLYVYMLATVTAGLQEKMQLLMTPHPGDVVVERWSVETVFVNFLTLFIYALGGVVIYSISQTGRPQASVQETREAENVEGATASSITTPLL